MDITTRIIPVDRDDPDPAVIEDAARVLRAGGLVAFATETVYGLGADATNPEALAGIFAAKGRPPSNPLIVHADGMEMARSCVTDWTEDADTLARSFWPGPLTLVLPRSRMIPDLVTAGRDTVGVRVPEPMVARRLITALGRPIAAPSANRSNRISPTRASHVANDLNGRIALILDSGMTTVGLESTVVVVRSRPPRILRPGPISTRDLRRVLNNRPVEEDKCLHETGTPSSPGQGPVHYAPRTKAVRVDPSGLSELSLPGPSGLLYFDRYDPPSTPRFYRRFLMGTPEVAAGTLYTALHELDALGLSLIVVVPPPDRPEWRAVRDRLWRATTPL